MAPSPSPDPAGPATLRDEDGAVLVDLADASLVTALGGAAPPWTPTDLPDAVRRPGRAFVTLHVAGQLNGCIGAVEPDEPLATAVARLARSAAFEDPRLPALRARDYPQLEIEVSVLSAPTPLAVHDRAQLLAALRPGADGLVIAAGRHRALFLPDVWDQLPDPGDFFDHLLAKAGLRPGTWPPGLRAERFTTQRWSRPAGQPSSGTTATGDGAWRAT